MNNELIVHNNIDQYWFEELREGRNGNHAGLFDGLDIVYVDTPLTLFRIFKNYWNGAVIWDRRVPSTVNVAFTAAGVDNLIPISYGTNVDDFYYYAVQQEKIFNVAFNMNGKFTGKGKIWGTDYELETNLIDVYMRRLRQKFEKPALVVATSANANVNADTGAGVGATASADTHFFIKTIRGVGYQMG
jgi:hypothetical protein